MSINVYHRLKWPVHKGVLTAYGKSNSGEVFQLEVSDGVFKKSRAKMKSIEEIKAAAENVYDTFFLFNDDFMFQLSINNVAIFPDLEKDFTELLEFLGGECYYTSLNWAVEAEEYDDISKCLVTTAPGPSETLIPVAWYVNGSFSTDKKFTDDDAKIMFGRLENKFPSVDLDTEYNLRFQEVNLLGGTIMFNRNHYGHNGKVSNSSLLRNVVAGIYESVRTKQDYTFNGIESFVKGASDVFAILPEKIAPEPASEGFLNPPVEDVKAKQEDTNIKGKGPLPCLDVFTQMANQ